MKILTLSLGLFASPLINYSDEPKWETRGLPALALNSFEAVDIKLNDSVKGGCMAKPDAVKKSAEMQLRRNNFKIGDNTTYSVPFLNISALGYRDKTKSGKNLGCTVHVDVRLRVAIKGIPYTYVNKLETKVAGVFQHDFTLASALMSDSSASNMQTRIEKVVEDAVDELFLRAQRAKDLLEKNFPDALALSE